MVPVETVPSLPVVWGRMTPLPYAALDTVRTAIRKRQIVTFIHKEKRIRVEPHCLALSVRYGAFILGAWVIGENRFDFFRYAEIRGLQVTEETFERARPEYNRTDRRIGTIDTSVPRSTRGTRVPAW